MSRPIKFRAWNPVKEKFWDGNGQPIAVGDGKVVDGGDWQGWYYNQECDYIVEQYTGLKDKNGKEIYEGDIVKYKLYADSRLDYIDEVFYSTISGAFMVGDEDNIRTLDCLINVEVIGNVHEPPKDFRPEHLKRMGVSVSKGGEDEQ